jgi:preprotein translocase subunit SecE
MSDQEKTTAVLEGASEVKTLTRSEQRKKNRLENRAKKKEGPRQADEAANVFVRAYNFFVEAKEELGRVVWPSRKETFDSTWRLLILVVFAGLFLGLVDGILTRLLSLLV